VRISRQDFELSSFPEKLLTVSSNEASFLEEEMERKRSKQMSANKNNKNGDHGDNDNTSSDNNNSKSDEKDKEKEKEKDKRSYSMDDCVLSTSIMHMWGYPLPPTPTPTLTLPCSTSSTASLATSINASSTTSSSKSGSLTNAMNIFGENTSEKRSRDENTDSEDGNIPKKVCTENSETKNLSENIVTEKVENNQENSGVKNMELETKNENENLTEAEVEVVWSDDVPIGATLGVIPTMRETKNIFNLKGSTQGEGEEVGSGIEGPESVATDCVEIEGGKGAVGGGEGAETGAGGDVSSTLPPLSLPLLYPSFEPVIQSTRGPNSGGPGVTGYRETISQYSEKFKTLWMSSTVNTRT
jgi:hypothetical protein